jgi:predicted  nucleic acid-binding Zn-ribbon protein
MSGLMLDYNAMTKCLEETTEALDSAEHQARAVQQECNTLKAQVETQEQELLEVRKQISMKESELEDCRIKLKWAQQAPRLSSQ